jgi:hypothetical protein
VQCYGATDRCRKDTVISKGKRVFGEHDILSRDAFDPDAVRIDDVGEDNVVPFLTLEVDGLTSRRDGREGQFELQPDDAEGLEVYGRESTLWRKILGYLGF